MFHICKFLNSGWAITSDTSGRKAGRIRRIELAAHLMTDRKQAKCSVAQILFWYNKGNGYGGTVCCLLQQI